MKPKKARVSPTNRDVVLVDKLREEIVELHLLVDMQKNLLRKLREQVAGWRPIAEYDAMAEKPKGFIVFRAAESRNGSRVLRPMLFTERYPGFRNVTHFYVLPEITE